jgi:diacylglycerol kinase family enzyme
MPSEPVDVIATTISGSISDWGKVKRIVPLFEERGRGNVLMHEAHSHLEARETTRERIESGTRIIISAGGSGTFNAVLEGCLDSGVGLSELTLGFLRKGSADLIGKALGMPDDITRAVDVFSDCLDSDRTVPCDVIEATGGSLREGPRHFVGYGGAEIFGRVPHFTENRFIKYYKGILSQLFGDMGPFFVGASLSMLEKAVRRSGHRRLHWDITVDGQRRAEGLFQAMIIVNGDLGPNLGFAKSVPLGSGDFHVFALRDLGLHRLPGQFRRAWDGSIVEQAARHGFEHYRATDTLKLEPRTDRSFPINVDGSTMRCTRFAHFRIADQIRLLSAKSATPPPRG